MKICIYGAGAVGILLGARLARQGAEVSVVARGETLAAIQQKGLGLQTAAGIEYYPVTVSADPATLGVQDLIIIAVKQPALDAVSRALAPLMGSGTRVLLAMNGVPWWFFDGLPGQYQGLTLERVDPDGQLRQRIPTAQVLGCVVHLACSTPQPGVSFNPFGNRLIIGRPAGPAEHMDNLIRERLQAAGFEVEWSSGIQQDIWFKLWGNMTMNPVSALTRATSDKVLDDELVNAFCSNAMQEAAAIGAVIGCPIDQTPQARNAVTRKLGAMRTSMLQDADAGKTLEVDALIGVVHEIGIRTGIATPNISALYGLIRLYAASAAGAGVRPSAAG
ncbi:MAG: 2-dehydropantoate 2-reductase [Thiothrix sp.]|nr:2-dehydropantoate 2-reductase [Thiothrix sp.]HPE61292.1 2-dehydropantoate 2-reductase [Thiolinea sp.]